MSTNEYGVPINYATYFAIPSDFVDNESASSVNVPFEALADRTAYLNANMLGSAWSGWSAPVTPQLGNGWTSATWDEANDRWLAPCCTASGGGSVYLLDSIDGGATWTICGSQVTGQTGSTIASQGGTACIAMPDAGGANLEVSILSGNTITTSTPGGGSGIPATIATVVAPNPTAASPVLYCIFAIQQSGTNTSNGEFWTTVNTVTWSAHGGLPSQWTGLTGQQVGNILYAQSSTTIVAVQTGVNGGVGQAYMMSVTWSAGTPIFTALITPATIYGAVSPIAQVTGLAYEPLNATWGIALWDGTNTYVYTSPDLATWTVQSNFVGKATSLVADHGVWAILAPYAQGPDNTTRVMLSPNAVTWSYAPMQFAGATGLATGGGSLCAWNPTVNNHGTNTGYIRVSQFARIS